MALFNFNAAEHKALQSFDVLPKGWYQAKLIESEAAATNGGGQMLKFTAEILAPAWAAGRKVFLRFNVVNSSEDAVRIGKEHLAAISLACGVPQWGNTEQLHEKPFHLKLKVNKGKPNPQTGELYDDSNDSNGYDPISVNRALAKQETSQPAAGGAPSTPFAVAAPTAAVQQPQAPVSAPTASFPGAPVQQPVQQPVQAPVQQAVAPVAAPQQEVVQQPAQPAAPQQAWANAPQQPWEAPAQAAPVQQPVQTPVQEQAAQPQVAPVQAPVQAPIEQPVQTAPVQQAAPVQQPSAQPWANQTVTPTEPTATAQQAAAAPVEPPHPAQATVPPWQANQ